MFKEQVDLDDELSNLFIRKDMNSFGRNGVPDSLIGISKPASINGLSKDEDTANCFSDSFASVYFDSYEDNYHVIDFLNRLNSVISLDTEHSTFDGSTQCAK